MWTLSGPQDFRDIVKVAAGDKCFGEVFHVDYRQPSRALSPEFPSSDCGLHSNLQRKAHFPKG